MLASITPLGERGRRSNWAVTATAFLLGGVAGGALAGALAGAAGVTILPKNVDGDARLAVLAVAALIALALDARSDPVLGPRRQVDERWLDQFRGWVYGLGFGAQLGVGVTTVVSSAATYLALIAAFLTRDAATGAAIVGLYGAIRGMTPLVSARIDRPERLFEFHARLERARSGVKVAAVLALAVIVAAAVAGAAS